MAKQMVYFNAKKQIETIVVHYNEKIDGAFVEDVCNYIKEISKKMSKINLKEPREHEMIIVYVYPSRKLFNQLFNGEIERRYYRNKHSLEDFYIIQDSEGNIHVASPSGKSREKMEALEKIIVMKVLGEYMDEKDKNMADKMLKASMLKKKEAEKEDELAEEELEEEEEELEEEEQELEEEELDELVEVEDELAEIDDDEVEETEEQDMDKQKKHQVEEIPKKVLDARRWLNIGWMNYLGKRLSKEKYVKYFADHISKNGVKKLSALKNSGWYETYNYSEEYAAAIVEYIIVTYGTKRFLEFYETPNDYKHVFGTTKLRFEQGAKAYIYSKYGPSRMKEEIDERGIEEVTQVKLNDVGGAEITTVGGDEERTIEEKTVLNLGEKS